MLPDPQYVSLMLAHGWRYFLMASYSTLPRALYRRPSQLPTTDGPGTSCNGLPRPNMFTPHVDDHPYYI